MHGELYLEMAFHTKKTFRRLAAQPFFQPIGGNERNWIFQNLEFREKIIEFSKKVLEFREKILEFSRKNLKFREKLFILGNKFGI